MNLTIKKITPSKQKTNLAFVDVSLNDCGVLIKGIKAIQTKDGMLILLPCLMLEKNPQKQNKAVKYSPVTFLSKDFHDQFINTVRDMVSKLLNLTVANK
jgi:DNA-binding cell septation regulator SpoVG